MSRPMENSSHFLIDTFASVESIFGRGRIRINDSEFVVTAAFI